MFTYIVYLVPAIIYELDIHPQFINEETGIEGK